MVTRLATTPFTDAWRDALVDALARDERFGTWARWFSARVVLRRGDEVVWLVFRHGNVVASGRSEPDDLAGTGQSTPTIALVGDDHGWAQVLEGLPGGLHRAWRQQLIQFDADPVDVLRNYRAIWHLGEVMVEISGSTA